MSLFAKFRQFERSDLGSILPKDNIDEIGRLLFDVIEELEIDKDIYKIQRSMLNELSSHDNIDIKDYMFRDVIYPHLIGLSKGGPPQYQGNRQYIYEQIEDDTERIKWRMKESIALLYLLEPFLVDSYDIMKYPRLHIMKIAYDNNDTYTLNKIKERGGNLLEFDTDILDGRIDDDDDLEELNLYGPIYDSIFGTDYYQQSLDELS